MSLQTLLEKHDPPPQPSPAPGFSQLLVLTREVSADYLSLGEFRRRSWEFWFQPVPLSLVFGISPSAETSMLKLRGHILHLSVTKWEGF